MDGQHGSEAKQEQGYRKLRVWVDAIDYYGATCEALEGFAFEHKRVAAYKIENELTNLIESLEKKRDGGDWNDTMYVKEPGAEYLVAPPPIQSSTHPADEDLQTNRM